MLLVYVYGFRIGSLKRERAECSYLMILFLISTKHSLNNEMNRSTALFCINQTQLRGCMRSFVRILHKSPSNLMQHPLNQQTTMHNIQTSYMERIKREIFIVKHSSAHHSRCFIRYEKKKRKKTPATLRREKVERSVCAREWNWIDGFFFCAC